MDLHLINRRLKDNYGQDFMGQPLYRVIWSDDQFEKRLSTFRDFVPGTNILLREVREVRECPKYPGNKSQYILEKLFFNRHNDEILDNDTLNPSTCTYEPLWAFDRGKPVIWRAIELIITSVNNPEKLTPKEMNDKELAQAKRDEQIFMDLMNEHIKNDSFHSSVKDGDTVLLNRDYKNGQH